MRGTAGPSSGNSATRSLTTRLRVKRLGLGRSLSRKRLTAARLTRELEQVLADPRIPASAASVAEEMRSEDGAETACKVLETTLDEHRGP